MTMWRMRFLMEGADGGGASGGGQVPPPAGATDSQQQTPTGDATTTGGGGGEGVTTKTGRVLPMAQTTIDKLKRDNIEKGKRTAQADLEKRAKAMGYDSVDEMFRGAERAKKGGQRQQQRNQGAGGSNGKNKQGQGSGSGSAAASTSGGDGQQQQAKPRGNRDDRAQRDFQERIDRERRQRINAEKRAQQAQRDQWAAEAHGELKVMALRVGVKDPDYAIELWTRECNAQRSNLGDDDFEKWLDKADEQAFFTDMKKTRPYLFEETVVPATTGTVKTQDGAPPPGAGKVTEAAAAGAQKKAKDMTQDEYHANLRARGLTPPGN